MLMCESKSEKGLSYEIKCTSCKDAQLAERKLLPCSPLARGEFRKRNSYLLLLLVLMLQSRSHKAAEQRMGAVGT